MALTFFANFLIRAVRGAAFTPSSDRMPTAKSHAGDGLGAKPPALRCREYAGPARRCVAALLAAPLMFVVAIWQAPALAAEAETGTGFRVGARFVEVSNLNDSGQGSLRQALLQTGPRIVVFSVGGYITLESDLVIQNGPVTIAGETAPGPGIVIRNGSVKIRTSNVELRHIAVYPGSTDDPKVAENRDGVSIYGSPSRKNLLHDVVLSNVSVGWAVDENVSLQGLVDGVRVERSLIAEPLRHGGHPKGVHAMNLLLANSTQKVDLLGNIFAVSEQRSPRLTNGNEVRMYNNFIYGFGRISTHIDRSQEILNAGSIDIVGNVYEPTEDSKCNQPIVTIAKDFATSDPPTGVFLSDNIAIGDHTSCITKDEPADTSPSALIAKPENWKVVPAADVYPAILDQTGARPLSRNPIDSRIVDGMRDHTLRIIDSEKDAGGWPEIGEVERALTLPIAAKRIATKEDLAASAAWLCGMQREVGGPSADCD